MIPWLFNVHILLPTPSKLSRIYYSSAIATQLTESSAVLSGVHTMQLAQHKQSAIGLAPVSAMPQMQRSERELLHSAESVMLKGSWIPRFEKLVMQGHGPIVRK